MYSSALTVKPKWLALILCGEKAWEIRQTNTAARGRIALVASGSSLIYGSVELFRTYHRTKRVLLSKTEHCIPEGEMKSYVTSQGAWVWELRNPMVFLRPFQVERREGSVSWVKLDEITMKSLQERPCVAASLDMKEPLLLDMKVAAEDFKSLPKPPKRRPPSPRPKRSLKERFQLGTRAEAAQFWRGMKVTDAKVAYKCFWTLTAWHAFSPGPADLLRRLLRRLCRRIKVDQLGPKKLKNLKKCLKLLRKKVSLSKPFQKLWQRIDAQTALETS